MDKKGKSMNNRKNINTLFMKYILRTSVQNSTLVQIKRSWIEFLILLILQSVIVYMIA